MVQPTSPQLQRERVLCAIAAAGSRFIPVPLADDFVKERATRTAVARTWRAHGRPPAPEVVAALSGDTTGTLTALRRTLRRLPLVLLLYPFRKLRLWLAAVQGVSGDLLQVLLLARAVDRCLAAGWFTGTDSAELLRQAELVRRAHDQAVHGADLHALRLALGAAFRQVNGLSRQDRDFARQASGWSAPEPDGAGPVLGGTAGSGLGDGADRVEAVLERPESARVLADLDARFDAALASLGPRCTTPPGGPAPSRAA
jgi:hypothetical protein